MAIPRSRQAREGVAAQRAAAAPPVVLLAALALALLHPCVATAAPLVPSSEQQLVDQYSPIVNLRAGQPHETCDKGSEQYSPPTSVDVVLGNPDVRLRIRQKGKTRTIKKAPTVDDLTLRRKGVYLDLPGSPLRPKCTYAKDYARLRKDGKVPAVTYARVARENGRDGLAVQYWFFYYFNQFNDLHEGDWEGMQLTFDSDSPDQAQVDGPSKIVLFQHAGGEHADWNDGKVEKDGTHPIVYSAAGSHATFYSSALWLGNGQHGSGVGCDNTTPPLVTVHPRPVLLPDTTPISGPFAWLSYTGRWGQREAGQNNGPTGPNTKKVWRAPFTWMDGTRASSPRVPGGSLLGPSVANSFCGAVAHVASFLNLAARTTLGAVGIALLIALIIVVPLFLTRWRPASAQPLRQVRALGQILLAAGRVYWRRIPTLAVIAAVSVVVLGAAEAIEGAVLNLISGSSSDLTVGISGGGVGYSTSIGFARWLIMPIVTAAVIAFMRNLDRGQPTGQRDVWGAVLRRLWRVVAVELLAYVLVVLLMATIIGIPYGLKKFVDWQFVQQEVLFEDRSIREALRGSTRVVKAGWWHCGGVALTLWIIGQIPGPLLGFGLLFTTVSAGAVNVIAAVAFALTLPYVGIGRTLLYFDLQARMETEREPAREPWWARLRPHREVRAAQ
jgi:hypothetical protein